MAEVVAAPLTLARNVGIIGNGETKKLPVLNRVRARGSIRLRGRRWRKNRRIAALRSGLAFCLVPFDSTAHVRDGEADCARLPSEHARCRR
jgi:hypothetical protein